MNNNTRAHSRHSIRLPGYDYASSGVYFVTLVTFNREHLFGELRDGAVQLSLFGQIAQVEWERLPHRFHLIQLEPFVFMPEHMHGLILMQQNNRIEDLAFDHRQVTAGSLGAIVRSYKSKVALQINRARSTPGQEVWQRNYYERIIRNEKEWMNYREYILNNPLQGLTEDNSPDDLL